MTSATKDTNATSMEQLNLATTKEDFASININEVKVVKGNSLLRLESELGKRHSDPFLIQQLWKELVWKDITKDLRYRVWKSFLGIDTVKHLEILPKVGDLENQRVIHCDASRTRGNLPFFKKQETIEMVSGILTYYCKCRSIRYTQGMNEVLAPFLLLKSPPLPEGVIFSLFYAFITKFLPNIYCDTEFRSLQCSFRLFRLLVLYHDPKLCQLLDQTDMSPELYATPWFMTLFSRNLNEDLLFYLWDFLILQNNPFLIHFISYSLLTSRREKLFQVDAATLPETLTSIAFDSIEDIQEICQNALKQMDFTPKTFLRDLYTVCYSPLNEITLPILHSLETSSCLNISTKELVEQLSARLGQKIGKDCSNSNSHSLELFVLDCRPRKDFDRCHLSLSCHMDPELLSNPDALKVVLEGLMKMNGCHFCLVGSGIDLVPGSTPTQSHYHPYAEQIGKQDDLSVTRFVLLLLQKGFQYISKMEDSFLVIEKVIAALDIQLQDHLLVKEIREEEKREEGFQNKAKMVANNWLGRIRSNNSSRMSQTLFNLKSVAKEAVSSVRRSSGDQQNELSFIRKKESIVQELNEQSLEQKELKEVKETQNSQQTIEKQIVLGEGHLGILFKGIKGELLEVVVDSVLPGSAAAQTGSITRGDILLAVNDINIEGKPFKIVMDILKGSKRPLTLSFKLPKYKMMSDIDAICLPLSPPLLIGKTCSSLSIKWESRTGGKRYQLQYAKRSDYYFNPWQSIGVIESEDKTKPLITSGTLVGLEPDSAFVFRVRCGTKEGWGSYSLSSSLMMTLSNENAMELEQKEKKKDPIREIRKEALRPDSKIEFLAGVCPESRELGCFYYRVLVALALRSSPIFDGNRLEKGLVYGQIIKCKERFNRPGSTQVFVRLWEEEQELWAFETTPDGAAVLEALPDYKETKPIVTFKSSIGRSKKDIIKPIEMLNNARLNSSDCNSFSQKDEDKLIKKNDKDKNKYDKEKKDKENTKNKGIKEHKDIENMEKNKENQEGNDDKDKAKNNEIKKNEIYDSFVHKENKIHSKVIIDKEMEDIKKEEEQCKPNDRNLQEKVIKEDFDNNECLNSSLNASCLISNCISMSNLLLIENKSGNEECEAIETTVHKFSAQWVKEEENLIPCHLIVSSVVLPSFCSCSSHVIVQTRHSLNNLLKITSSKTIPNLTSFQFKIKDSVDIAKVDYIIEDMKECIQLITKNYKKIINSSSNNSKMTEGIK